MEELNINIAEEQNEASSGRKYLIFTSFALHILAMAFMLCDHLWATVVAGNAWLTCIGRLAFPIFAFLTVEGYFHTKNFKKYASRMLIFALLSEIPFNLMYSASVFYLFGQNVLWSFLISLFMMRTLDKIRKKHKLIPKILLCALALLGFWLLGTVTFVDYYGYGILTCAAFYFFRGETPLHKFLQAVAVFYINFFLIKGVTYPFTFFGATLQFPQQGFAVLALIPTFLYNGKQGPHNKYIKYAFYAFYPLHMLILGLLSM